MGWSNNNKAHRELYLALVGTDQFGEPVFFADAGGRTMASLDFFPGGADAGNDLEIITAGAQAALLDSVFNQHSDASYEEGVNAISAIQSMMGVLRNGTRTVAELGEVVDAAYRFLGEDPDSGEDSN